MFTIQYRNYIDKMLGLVDYEASDSDEEGFSEQQSEQISAVIVANPRKISNTAAESVSATPVGTDLFDNLNSRDDDAASSGNSCFSDTEK